LIITAFWPGSTVHDPTREEVRRGRGIFFGWVSGGKQRLELNIAVVERSVMIDNE